jgi:RNA polymerase sigma-70 factor (ECF subfamily)
MVYEKFISLLKENKDVAYNYLYATLSALIFSTIKHYTNNNEEAEDISQDVWIKIYLNIDKFKGGNFKLWLINLCHRICIDKYRRKKASDKPNHNTSDINTQSYIGCDYNICENKYSYKDLILSEISNSLNNLTETQKDCVLLKLKGLTFNEIAILTKKNQNSLIKHYQLSIVDIINQLERKGLVTSKRIDGIKEKHYNSPKYYKVAMAF